MRYLIFSVFLFSSLINGQERSINVFSLKDSVKVKDAFVILDGKALTFTDNDGSFRILTDIKFDSLVISHLNYKNRVFSYETFNQLKNIYLENKEEELEAVFIENKKFKFVQLLPPQSLFSKLGYYKGHKTHFNAVYATYIPNKNYKNNNSYIKNIIIEPHSGYWGDKKKEFMPFKVNLYSVDSITKLPSDKILPDKFLAVKKVNGKKIVEVNIEDYDLEFPSEGIYVAVETFTKQEYLNLQSISFEAPAFKIIRKKKNTPYVTYSRWYDEDGNIKKDWIDDKLPELDFIFNFGIEIEFLN
jgi:hypothetical protein